MAIDIGDVFKEKGEPTEAVFITVSAASVIYALASGWGSMTPAIITALATSLSACQLALTVVLFRLVLRSHIREINTHNKKTALLSYVRKQAQERAQAEGKGDDDQRIERLRIVVLEELRGFIEPKVLPDEKP